MRLVIFMFITLVTFCSAHEDFSNTCPPSTCGSFQIRFPFRLQSDNPSCGLNGLDLSCSNNKTLYLLAFPQFKITNINYGSSQFTIDIGSKPEPESSPCLLQNLSAVVQKLNTPNLKPFSYSVSFVRCATKVNLTSGSGAVNIAGPIQSCYDQENYFVYVVDVYEAVDRLPRDCEVFWVGGEIPYDLSSGFVKRVEDFGERKDSKEVIMFWVGEVSYECGQCEQKGKHCGFDWSRNQSFCFSPTRHQHQHQHGPGVMLITGSSIIGLLILLAVSFILLYVSRQSAKEKEIWLKVEKFLATYKTAKPTRYSYAEIKKITKRFRYKLGQGGFGSVYKGELPNGIPVAVKMLENSKGEGDEFINEVATIGRVHHFNIVRLLGFCSEGTRRALIYEFMPNESLEKFIYSKEAERGNEPLNMEKLLDIAIGIAQGIEYLHQGCDQRILHFDIKPHNILLDHKFIPKVSDFGLAKLCARDQSIITMTAARGTMGYIAPEMFSRNFGEVSYKSDVYSFGMLLLEMVSGKKTIEPATEKQDEVYFPEWIYDRLIKSEDLGLLMENEKEEDIVKKLVIVALWCIQWSPDDRPTMTRALQFLNGNLESLQIPPKPFISAHQDNGTYISD